MMASDSSSMADDQACVESVRDAGTPSQTSGRFDPITAHLKITEKGREEAGERLEALEEANGPEWPKEASWQSPADEAVLSLTNFCDRGQVADFWATKDRLDALFESPFNIGQYYYLERTRFFKAATGDSASASKGTGPVFAELLAAAGVSPSSEAQCNVVDICGGPGLQSEYFLGLNARNRSWGMTFESQDTRKHPSWSPRLLGNPCFTHVVGHHRDGNPCRPENLRYLKDQICGLGQTISYVLCDGFVSVKSAKGPRGQAFRCENLQESFNLRLLVSELLAALLTLSEDGHVIIKMFEIFSDQTASLVLMVLLAFDDCILYKPGKSHHIHTEKYLVGRRYRRDHPLTARIVQFLQTLHTAWPQDRIPEVILPLDMLAAVENFQSSLVAFNEACVMAQHDSIEGIMDGIARKMPSVLALWYQEHIDTILPSLFAQKKTLTPETPADALKLRRLNTHLKYLCADSQIIACRPLHFPPRPAPAAQSDASQKPKRMRVV